MIVCPLCGTPPQPHKHGISWLFYCSCGRLHHHEPSSTWSYKVRDDGFRMWFNHHEFCLRTGFPENGMIPVHDDERSRVVKELVTESIVASVMDY